MTHFTAHHDPAIDARVRRDLATIRDTLRARFPTIRALLLVGGFGRGEGSVRVAADGTVTPLNDYDVMVLYEGALDRRALAAARAPLAATLGIWLLDLLPYDLATLPALPLTQLHWDCAQGHFQFYGDPAAVRFPAWHAGDIPLASGKTILFNRLVTLLEAYHSEWERALPSPEQQAWLATQAGKAALACCDALLIAEGAYEMRYGARPQRFAATLPTLQAEAALVERACQWKRFPSDVPPWPVLPFWHAVAAWYARTMSDVLTRFYRRRWHTWDDFDRFYSAPWRASNRRASARDALRRLRGRPARARQIRHLELAALRLVLAQHAPHAQHLRAARCHLQRSGAPSGAETWEALRAATVAHWYTIKH